MYLETSNLVIVKSVILENFVHPFMFSVYLRELQPRLFTMGGHDHLSPMGGRTICLQLETKTILL